MVLTLPSAASAMSPFLGLSILLMMSVFTWFTPLTGFVRLSDSEPDVIDEGGETLKYPAEYLLNWDRPWQNSPGGQRQDLTRGPSDWTEGTKNCTVKLHHANCSYLSLREVPQYLPTNIQSLDLSHNWLFKLSDYVFAKYFMLHSLDLSHNSIHRPRDNAFYNLTRLKRLKMDFNELPLISPLYPDNVFCPLTSLTYLDISGNTGFPFLCNLQYPDKALSCLTNLQSLYVDGIPMNKTGPTFGDGFRNLTKLINLSLAKHYNGGLCNLEGLYNDSFRNIEIIEHLNMSNCIIDGERIDTGAFENLKNLRSLDLSENWEIDIQHLRDIFYQLDHLENLTDLHIGSIVSQHSPCNCLGVSAIKYIPQHLTYINFRGNNLEAVEPEVIDNLPPNLTILEVSGNKFEIGNYFKHLHKMEKLTHLYLNHFQHDILVPRYYPSPQKCGSFLKGSCTEFDKKQLELFVLNLPPNLESVEMNKAGLTYIVSHTEVSRDNSLTYLSLNGNHFPELVGPVHNLHSLKVLDISEWSVKTISSTFFDDFEPLQILRLDSNSLGDFLADYKNRRVFDGLTNLKSLNLSHNYIRTLTPEIVHNLHNLSRLYLRNNPPTSFDVKVSSLRCLDILDLSETQIPTLLYETRIHIDNLVTEGVNVFISMKETPISCNCFNLSFLEWMTTTKAFSKPFHGYVCTTDRLSRENIIDDYDAILSALRRKCTSNTILLFLVASATAAVLCIIICSIVYRFRWNIRYLYYAAYLRYQETADALEIAYEYDAFICYAGEDSDFVESTVDTELSSRGLKIFLHGRDFRAGEYITSNIVSAVCSCKKTVVLLTKAVLDSYWCGYEIEMAKLEGIHSGRQVLIFVVMEEIPRGKLGRDLLYNIKNNTYIEYDLTPVSRPDHEKIWWDKLANDIRA